MGAAAGAAAGAADTAAFPIPYEEQAIQLVYAVPIWTQCRFVEPTSLGLCITKYLPCLPSTAVQGPLHLSWLQYFCNIESIELCSRVVQFEGLQAHSLKTEWIEKKQDTGSIRVPRVRKRKDRSTAVALWLSRIATLS